MSCIIEGANARSETSEVKDFSAAVIRFPYVLGVRGLTATKPEIDAFDLNKFVASMCEVKGTFYENRYDDPHTISLPVTLPTATLVVMSDTILVGWAGAY